MNKLLVVLVLAVLSLCELEKHEFRSRFSRIKTNDDGDEFSFQNKVLYFDKGSINDNHELIIDITARDLEIHLQLDEILFSDRNPYRPGTSIEDTSFLAIPKEGFADLKTSQPLNDSEKSCSFVQMSYRFEYADLGYTAKAIKNVDIAPSITYIMKNYPTKQIYRLEGEEFEYDIEELACDKYYSLWYYISFVVHKYGIVGTDCIPNTGIPSGTTDACSPGSTGKYEKWLVGYKEALFFGDNDAVKEALIKFGPIYHGDYGKVIGWEGNNWVTVEVSESTGRYVLGTQQIDSPATDQYGYVYASVDGSNKPVIPAADCTTTPSLPECSGDCNPNTGKTEEQCACIDGDIRPFCKTCTGKNQPTVDCKCPDVKEGDYTKAKCEEDKGVIPPSDCTGKTEEQCACIDGDTRPFCKTCTGKNQPTVDCKCPDVKEGDYTKDQCDQDKRVIPQPADCTTTPSLPACSGDCVPNTGKTEEQCACIVGDTRTFCVTCTGKNLPTADCKCPVDSSGTYTSAKCEEDKMTSVDCSHPRYNTPKKDCPCPDVTDKATWEADPRTYRDGICEPDICTAKDTPYAECLCSEDDKGTYTQTKCEVDKASSENQASESIRMNLSMIAVAFILPVLALFL